MLRRRRSVLIVTLAVALLVMPFIFANLKPTYTATSHVLMVGKDSMIPSGDMGTLTVSATVLNRVAKEFSLDPNIGLLRARIDAHVSLRSNVMPITYRDKNQKLAYQVANALADQTVDYYKDLSSGQYDQMISYLRNEAQHNRALIQNIDTTLQKAAQRDTFVGSDSALETITARIGDLQTQRGVAYATLVSDEAIASAQSAQPREISGIVTHEVLASDPYVQALRSNQSRDAAQLQFERAQFTDKYPGLPSLEDQVQRERSVVAGAEKVATSVAPTSSASYAATVLAKRSALAVAAGDRAKVAALDAQIAAEEGHLRDLPVTGTAVNILRVEREGARASYAGTIARLSETQAEQAAAASLGSIVVIDRAADASPRIPRIAMDIIVAFLLLALTLTAGFIVDVVDPRLRSPESIEKLYGLPIVGNLGSR
jgi:uncharacterized protein involved in exopolysaccharide biosynthesis